MVISRTATSLPESHSCVDQPNLTCSACESAKARNATLPKGFFNEFTDQARAYARQMATLAFRFGYRAALLDASSRGDVIGSTALLDDKNVKRRAQDYLGEDYAEIDQQ